MRPKGQKQQENKINLWAEPYKIKRRENKHLAFQPKHNVHVTHNSLKSALVIG
jgi:hypothetical protein